MLRVVISLTTIPGRNIIPTLKSLQNQTYKADVIYLGVPKICKRTNEKYNISDDIKNLCTIVNIEEDYGPITKLLGGLYSEHDPSTIIITVDDDRIYSNKFIQEFIEKHKHVPDRVLASSGCIIGSLGIYPASMFFYFTDKDSFWYHPKIPRDGTEIDVLYGYSGVLYQRGFFPKNLLNFLSLPLKYKDLFLNDDVYISAYLNSRGIKIHLYPYFTYTGIDVDTISKNGLSNNFIRFSVSLNKAINLCYKLKLIKLTVHSSFHNHWLPILFLIMLMIIFMIIKVLSIIRYFMTEDSVLRYKIK